MKILEWLAILAVVLSVGSFGAGVLWNKWLPVLEGDLVPVVRPAELVNVTREGDQLRLHVTAEKVRGECAGFVRIEWFLGEPGRSVRVFAEFQDRPQVREGGDLEWTDLVVGLPERDLRHNSYAYVYHDCNGLWETRSLFWRANDGEKP